MNPIHNRSLFIFRQDLRTYDNTGLLKAVQISKEIVPIFILDTEILAGFPPQDTRLSFLVDCLFHLNDELRKLGSQLYVYHGRSSILLPELVRMRSADCVVWNKSYGQGSRTRDNDVVSRLSSRDIDYYISPDYLLVEPDAVEQRKVFTPFYKLRMGIPKRYHPKPAPSGLNTPPPATNKHIDLHIGKEHLLEMIDGATPAQVTRTPTGGRDTLASLPLADYSGQRNFPADHTGTSRLSPYLAFGIVSIREVLHAVLDTQQPGIELSDGIITMDKKTFSHTFVSELARREFWQHIAYYFPDSRHTEFLEKRRGLNRVENATWLDARKEGKTGYPIVDAAMRQLRTENWMHGRCRMIVASFLTKDMLIDWRLGENHFKDYLLDYDKAVNIGNRQRSASVGADPKPLRIFNPILQSQKYDPDATYIKKRLPELVGQPIKAIHDPLSHDLEYIPPIVNHKEMYHKAKAMYKKESYTL